MNFSGKSLNLVLDTAQDLSKNAVISNTFSVWEKLKTNKARSPKYVVNEGRKFGRRCGYKLHSTFVDGIKQSTQDVTEDKKMTEREFIASFKKRGFLLYRAKNIKKKIDALYRVKKILDSIE